MASQSQSRAGISLILRRLERFFGPVEPPEQLPVLDELVATILSQNTSNSNSSAAFDELRRRFPDWEAVRRAPAKRVAAAIRIGGLANQKAPRIKALLQRLYVERGELSLEFLHELPLGEAREYLRRFPGVGPKTAACTLLFACRKPILPVDTHIHRISQRLGLIGPRINEAQSHDDLARLVSPERVLDFHIQLIRHGREICAARNPRCFDCVLLDRCPTGLARLQQQVIPLGPVRSPSHAVGRCDRSASIFLPANVPARRRAGRFVGRKILRSHANSRVTSQ